MTKEIQLANGKGIALVDDEDFELVSNFKWSISNGRYAQSSRLHMRMHRLILGLQPNDKVEIDHINGNGLDNRRCNLRPCKRGQNRANQRKSRGLSRYKGVSWSKDRQKWQAHIKICKHSIGLGRFVNEENAARAYDEAARRYFGEFARTNFP